MTERTLCQACRSAPIEMKVESDEPLMPFEVCQACAHRLQTYSLRPLEWFNLAAIHGSDQFLLDEFYDTEGDALEPQAPVIDAQAFPMPTLDEVANDVERLLDYARSDHLRGWLMDALDKQDKTSILRSLQKRIAAYPTEGNKIFAYKLCAKVLGQTSEEWVRSEWDAITPEFLRAERRGKATTTRLSLLKSLADASAVGLPPEEGYQRVIAALAELPPKERSRMPAALYGFRSKSALDWIEQNVSTPVHFQWGTLAAVSELNWSQALKWLESGRPLSLVALDALRIFACGRSSQTLLKPALVSEINAALEMYLERDPVPRVREAVAAIKESWK